jgi:DNA-binding transcriptional LysR family regulator
MIDQLRQMAIFAKTIDHGSFRGAASELRLSPSVVSHHVSHLEESLGVALIYRTTRKLTLTREGERLLAATRAMLEAAESEMRHLSASAATPSGELRITVPSVLSQSVLTERIAAFSKTYPKIQMSIDFSDARRELIDDGFDFAVRMGPKIKRSPTARSMFKVTRKLVVASDYAASRPEPRHPTDLVDWAWLALTPVQNVPLKFAKRGEKAVAIKPRAQIYTNDAQALYRLARSGAGLAIIPDFLATNDLDEGRVVNVLPDWAVPSIEVYAVWPSNAPKHGLIRLAIDALSQPPKPAS